MNTPNAFKELGYSIIELMIALLLGAFLLIVIVSNFGQSSRNQFQDEQLNITQENGRFAIREVTRSLSLAGYWGGIADAAGITLDASVAITGCSAWASDVAGNPVTLLNNATAGDIAGSFDCVDTTDFIDGTDVIGLLRVADAPLTTPNASGVNLAGNSATGIMFEGSTMPAGVVAPAQIWRYLPEIYYIIDQPNAAGDSVPTLCRYSLIEGGSTMERRCLADGIENMQIEYGIDTDSDYVADYYDNAPTAAAQANAISAKIYFLARSTDPVSGYTNNKAYNLGATVIPAANDGFLRRVFSTSIELKNSDKLSVTPFEPTN
jgi:type II secretory pathway pseudopilin PulG